MSLLGKYYITPAGAVKLTGFEHDQLALAVMLKLDRMFAPRQWTLQGVPDAELDAALDRGSDPAAIKFLENPKHDARLWAAREWGWVRTYKNLWNLWEFDCETADMVRASDYWDFQRPYDKDDRIDVEEIRTRDSYEITVGPLLSGGNPEVLKNLAMGRVSAAEKIAPVCPSYSTAKYGEIARRSLYGRTSENPRRRRS